MIWHWCWLVDTWWPMLWWYLLIFVLHYSYWYDTLSIDLMTVFGIVTFIDDDVVDRYWYIYLISMLFIWYLLLLLPVCSILWSLVLVDILICCCSLFCCWCWCCWYMLFVCSGWIRCSVDVRSVTLYCSYRLMIFDDDYSVLNPHSVLMIFVCWLMMIDGDCVDTFVFLMMIWLFYWWWWCSSVTVDHSMIFDHFDDVDDVGDDVVISFWPDYYWRLLIVMLFIDIRYWCCWLLMMMIHVVVLHFDINYYCSVLMMLLTDDIVVDCVIYDSIHSLFCWWWCYSDDDDDIRYIIHLILTDVVVVVLRYHCWCWWHLIFHVIDIYLLIFDDIYSMMMICRYVTTLMHLMIFGIDTDDVVSVFPLHCCCSLIHLDVDWYSSFCCVVSLMFFFVVIHCWCIVFVDHCLFIDDIRLVPWMLMYSSSNYSTCSVVWCLFHCNLFWCCYGSDVCHSLCYVVRILDIGVVDDIVVFFFWWWFVVVWCSIVVVHCSCDRCWLLMFVVICCCGCCTCCYSIRHSLMIHCDRCSIHCWCCCYSVICCCWCCWCS